MFFDAFVEYGIGLMIGLLFLFIGCVAVFEWSDAYGRKKRQAWMLVSIISMMISFVSSITSIIAII